MHRGHDAWAAFNMSDKVTVALVLNRADWLEEFGCTLADAIEEAGEEWIRRHSSDCPRATRRRAMTRRRQPIQPTTGGNHMPTHAANKRSGLVIAAAVLLTATPSFALFGIGDVVFDPLAMPA